MSLEQTIRDAYVASHPDEVARLVESMETQKATTVVAELPEEQRCRVLEVLTPLTAATCLEALPPVRSAATLNGVRRDLAAAIMRCMKREQRAATLESMPPKARESFARLLRYAEGTAGSLMDPRVLTVTEDATVRSTLDRVQATADHALYYIYVVDETHRLVGVVNLRELLGARHDQLVGLIATHSLEILPVGASWQSVYEHPAWKRFHALPVVEPGGRFAGVVRYEVVLDRDARVRGSSDEDPGGLTAAALGELYGLGLRGLADWASIVFFGATDGEETRR